MSKLRVCASCEWIFNTGVECPQCQFGSYVARYAYGPAAYRYQYSQKPWKVKKMQDYELKLNRIIREHGMGKPDKKPFFDFGSHR